MKKPPAKRGRVAVIGAGPGGLAAALSVHQAGHDVVLTSTSRFQAVWSAGVGWRGRSLG
jgi:2-polyprenyl-6-methoxyphenol hydroxylase-like FAD-dependent oxidoreductase